MKNGDPFCSQHGGLIASLLAPYISSLFKSMIPEHSVKRHCSTEKNNALQQQIAKTEEIFKKTVETFEDGLEYRKRAERSARSLLSVLHFSRTQTMQPNAEKR